MREAGTKRMLMSVIALWGAAWSFGQPISAPAAAPSTMTAAKPIEPAAKPNEPGAKPNEAVVGAVEELPEGASEPKTVPLTALRPAGRHGVSRDKLVVGVLPAVQVRGLVKMGPGYSSTLEGFGPQVVREAAALVGLEVELVALDSKATPEGVLGAGLVDAVVGVSVTSERMEVMDFTVPIMVARGAVYARAGTPRADTAGRLKSAGVVATAKNGVAAQWCVERRVPFRRTETLREAMGLLLVNEADYVVTTMPAGRSELEELGLSGIQEWPLHDERLWRAFAVAVRHGDTLLASDLNNGLVMLRDSGRFEALYDATAGRYQPRSQEPEVPRLWLWWTASGALVAVAGAMLGFGVVQRRLRRKTEDLLTSQREQKLLFDEVPALVYTYFVGENGERRLLSAGEGLARWKERFPGLSPGRKWEASTALRMHPEDVEGYRAATERARATRGVFAAEYRLLDRDGRYRWLHSRVAPAAAEGGVVWCAMLMDVTDVREMRAELERTQTLYRELFDNCPEAILLVRAGDSVIVEANLAALELYDLRRGELVGSPFGMLRLREGLGVGGEVLRQGYVQQEERHRRSDGTPLDVEVVGSLVEIGGDRQCMLIVRDVTERKRMERQRAGLEAELQSARQMEALGVMAGGIAHDFNNVLVGILGNASLAKRQVDSPEALTSSLSRIEEAGQFAADLVRQLMEYAGRRPTKSEPVELSSVAREVVQALGSRVKPRVTVVGGESWAQGDVVSIKQAVMNLVTNASDAIGEESGEIRVRCGTRRFEPGSEEACVVGRELPAGRYGFVCVEDTGPGLDEGVRRRMFEPFVTTKGPGRGLGLAMVVTAMQRCGGAVTVRTQAGVGTWFELLLPAAGRAEGAEGGAGGLDVLVVDDDPSVRATLRELMRLEGHACREAASGEEGLAMAAGAAPDVVILDINMPGMSGWEVLRELRRRGQEAAVVVSSGHTTRPGDGDVRADAVLPKPYTLEQLRAAIAGAMAGRRAGSGV